MPSICEFVSCKNRKKDCPKIIFHRFPVKDSNRLNIWMINSGNVELFNLDLDQLRNRYLCDNHFNRDAFVNDLKRKLTKTAIHIAYKDSESSNLVEDKYRDFPSTSKIIRCYPPAIKKTFSGIFKLAVEQR